ncbi:electron transfer flavoprotein subunit alpha [Nocardioides baekrokdamisoli]|uniref:Electron transfer flavoprotein subunit alpha n=1 Tax=Nocardioides baekrokdamisoli TaxID=1804624 RepID=A0A3G9IX95_9ACTN|nr:electron transfer flavoprotein subunit alpha/FixB family protein [Nocardioides baekrokdamisoli]BBH15794.1 electron transfer flavoprotein subunit alpha [Nocardioides baekrokdamisoli]
MIVVLVETDVTGAVEVSRETITFARGLSASGGGVPIDAVVIGDLPCDPTALAEQLAAYGVRDVHHASGDAFSAYGGAAWAAAVQSVRDTTGAVVVTAAGTPRGGEVLAHVAARTGVAMAANVIAFGGLAPFTVTRQVVGGSAWEEMVLDERPAIFTVAGHAVAAEEAPSAGAGHLVEFQPEVEAADLVARVTSTAEPEPDLSGSLKGARVVVGAGRGAGSADGFGELLDLVGMLDGASLGVSRVVTSLGWRPHHEQVGQTGSRVSPDLYLACGISGAIQHWAGMASSKTIVAINTDEEAPMVAKAHYAVIGDMHEILPAINEEIRKRKS